MTPPQIKKPKPLFIPNGEFGITCENCRYTRKTGKAIWEARRLARQHAHKYADHVVCVTETKIIQRWEGYTPKLLPDEPPF